MQRKTGAILLIISAAITLFTAVAHMSCLVLGPTCYEVQMAPPQVVQSAREGTLYAPVATTMVSALFVLCALYALSGAGKIRRLPFLSLAIYTIATICILRGFAVVPINFWLPDVTLRPRDWIVGGIWAFTGFCFLFGYRTVNKAN